MTKAKAVNCKTCILPSSQFPQENDVDAVPIYLPLCITIFCGQSILEGNMNDSGVFDSFLAIHLIVAVWYDCVVNARYLKKDYYKKNGWELVELNGYTNDVSMSADLPVLLIRTGPTKIAFDHKVQDYINSVSVPDDDASSSDEARVRVRSITSLEKKI